MSDSNKTAYLFPRQAKSLPQPTQRELYAMIATMWMVMFIAGWNDSSQGPLLPLLQEYYSVRYTVISLIWISCALGVVVAAFSNVWMTDRLGFGIVTPIGAFAQALSYVFMSFGGPFPLFVFAYAPAGMGLGWQDAQVNALASRMPNETVVMFLVHAMYGLGATVSPFISTAFIQRLPSRFYLYFTVSLGLAILNTALLVVIFRGRTEDQIVGRHQASISESPTPREVAREAGTENVPLTELVDGRLRGHSEEHDNTGDGTGAKDGSEAKQAPFTDEIVNSLPTQAIGPTAPAADEARDSGAKVRDIVKSGPAWFLALYIFMYMGIEITIGGWATTFLITERGGDSNSGYVSAGYFGGLTLGRVILIPVTTRLGHRLSIYIYTALCIAFEILILLVRSLIGNIVCFSLIGVFLGPMYPSVMLVCAEIMPYDLRTGTIGLVACVGVVGSAIMPFITGALADRYGVWVLQPLMLALLAASIGMWTLVARVKKTQ